MDAAGQIRKSCVSKKAMTLLYSSILARSASNIWDGVIFKPRSILPMISGAIWSRCFVKIGAIMVANKTARRVWNASSTPVKSGMSFVTSAPRSAKIVAAPQQTFAIYLSIETMERSGLNATRFGMPVPCKASTNDGPS